MLDVGCSTFISFSFDLTGRWLAASGGTRMKLHSFFFDQTGSFFGQRLG
jgi:hypothetical protein